MARLPRNFTAPESAPHRDTRRERDATTRPSVAKTTADGAEGESGERLEAERQLAVARSRVEALDKERLEKLAEIETLTAQLAATTSTPSRGNSDPESGGACPEPMSNKRKLEIFRDLFRGREDVYPTRWENLNTGKSGYTPECSNKFVEGVCGIKHVKCGACRSQKFRPVDEQAYSQHFRGRHVMGVYPLLPDDTCWFLAIDFDEDSWKKDVVAVRDTCRSLGLPVYVETFTLGKWRTPLVLLQRTHIGAPGTQSWLPLAYRSHECTTRAVISIVR